MEAALDALQAEMDALRRRVRDALSANDLSRVASSREQLQRTEAAWHALVDGSSATSSRPMLSTRERVLQTLQLLGSPAPHQLILDIHRAFHGVGPNEKTLTSLRRDEQRSYNTTRSDRTYVCAALTEGRFTVAPGLLAHSKWPLERRIVTPTSRQANLFTAAIRIIDAAKEGTGPKGMLTSVAGILRPYLGDHMAAEIPAGPEELRVALCEELHPIRSRDEAARKAGARSARARLSPEHLLFGVPRN